MGYWKWLFGKSGIILSKVREMYNDVPILFSVAIVIYISLFVLMTLEVVYHILHIGWYFIPIAFIVILLAGGYEIYRDEKPKNIIKR